MLQPYYCTHPQWIFCRPAPKASGFVYPAGKAPKSQTHTATPIQPGDPLQPQPHNTEPQGFSPTSHRQPPAQHFRQKNGKYWKRNVGDKPVRASLAELSENSTISSHGRSDAAQSSGTIPDTFALLFQTARCKNGVTPLTARQVKGKNHHLFPKASVC